jgi:O-methyltransferase
MRESLYTVLRDNLLQLPWMGQKVDAYRRDWRVRKAARFIESGWLYANADREGILRDYRAICVDTQLTISGICNLECIARHVISNGMKGAFVECGTWRGGAIGFWARSYLRNGGDSSESVLYGFDSFEGMPRMTGADGEGTSRWLYGKSIGEIENHLMDGALVSTGANMADEESCRKLVEASGYHRDSIHIIKGWFQDTLPRHISQIGPIAVLRLDGDFYESTRFCLETLYDSVISGGVVIIDDYGSFHGCKKAVDEFLSRELTKIHLIYVDVGMRYLFKP